MRQALAEGHPLLWLLVGVLVSLVGLLLWVALCRLLRWLVHLILVRLYPLVLLPLVLYGLLVRLLRRLVWMVAHFQFPFSVTVAVTFW